MGIFHNLFSRAFEQDSRLLSRLWNRRTQRTLVTIISAGALVAVYYSKQETIPYSKRSHLILMSHEMEKRRGDYWKSQPSQFFEGDVLPRNHVESIRVNSVASTMIDALNRDIKEENVWPRRSWRNCERERRFIQGMKWEVVVVDNPIRNAYCLPAGKILVSTGMLTHLRTDAEVARLIGHEMGHAVGRHYAERSLLETTLLKFWFLVYLLAPWMLLIRKFSDSESENCMTKRIIEHPRRRKREIEADYIGLLLMASAGYDPRIAPEEQKRLGYSEHQFKEYSSTYPTAEKRAELLAQDHVMEEALLFYNKARGRKSEVKLNTSKESISQKESINSNN